MRSPILDPLRHRCLLVVAAAGYGKTTALRSWLPQGVAWGTVADLPDLLSSADVDGRRWVVVDDVPRLRPDAERGLFGTVVELPDSVRLAVATRWPPSQSLARLRGRGLLAEAGPAELAFSTQRTAAVLRRDHGLIDPDLARRVHAATAGWPALVRLAGETLAAGPLPPDGQLLAALAEPDTPVASYVADEILGALPADVRRLVRDVADLSPLSAELCQALGHRRASGAVRLLARTGVLEGGQSDRIVPLVAAVAARRDRGAAVDRRRARTAAAWYAKHGPPVAAARAHLQAGEQGAAARVLVTAGAEMVAAGGAGEFADLVSALAKRRQSHRLRLLLGEALTIVGDGDTALSVYAALAGEADAIDPGLAWRMGFVHYLRGDPRTALAVYAKAGTSGKAADRALLSAWTATAHWSLGDVAACADHARQGHEHAMASGDERALAAAHVTLALYWSLAADPAGSQEHYARALGFAEAARDVVEVTRIRVNRAHHLLVEARYADVLAEIRPAAELCERTGHAAMLAVALCNEAEALARLGRFDEAAEGYQRALALYQRMGSRWVAFPLVGSGTSTGGRASATRRGPPTRRPSGSPGSAVTGRPWCRRLPAWRVSWSTTSR